MSMRKVPSLLSVMTLVVPATATLVRSADPAPAPTTAPTADAYHARIVPLLERYCYECHGDGASSGDLEMDAFKTIDDVRRGTKTWQKVIQYIRTQTMPPPKAD